MESSVKKSHHTHHVLLLGNHNPHLLNTVAQTMERNGFQVTKAPSGRNASEELKKKDFDLVITDLNWLLIGGKVPFEKPGVPGRKGPA
jgi:DNA-binding response OmpR family regulator